MNELKDLEAKIAELEQRIKSLETRPIYWPVYIPQPYPYYVPPVLPYWPAYPVVTCGGSGGTS